jgi:VanZ family protein
LNVIAHFTEYLALAACLAMALNGPRRKLWQAALLAIAVASLYGVSDELHQLFVPGRESDPMDWLTDTLGACLGAVVAVWVAAARQVSRSRERDREV